MEADSYVKKTSGSITAPIYVRAYDVDAMGYVSNIVYVRWFEDLRHRFLDLCYPFQQMIQDQLSPVLMHTEVDYLIPLTIHDVPEGHCTVEKFGRTKWSLNYEIVQGGKVHCRGRQTGYMMDLGTKKPVPIPERMRRAHIAD